MSPVLSPAPIPGGASLAKPQFTIFVPAAGFFRVLRTSQAPLDRRDEFAVSAQDNGLERFLTATRRAPDWGRAD